MKATKIILAGGFLGAGKTTLLWSAAQRLMQKGLKVGLITNDQAPELVDSALLTQKGLTVSEVNGSCFCCNFNGFIQAAQALREKSQVDVIIAEPVGSCTDLSATILQPLKKHWREQLDLAPLTVLADPIRLASTLSGGSAGLHKDAAYIYRKQLEESDIILITKTKKYAPDYIVSLKERAARAYPFATVLSADSISGKGLDEWMEVALHRKDAGLRIAAVDYDVYAHGEAVLGWLNGTLTLQGKSADWNTFCSELLGELSARFTQASCTVGHVKLIAENGNRYIAGNLTDSSSRPATTGSMESCDEIRLTINARVETSPENLSSIVKDTLDSLVKDKYSAQTLAWRCLSPGRPNPTYRFDAVC
ncbi:MAG: cobalamin synthesis protein P47K [Prevotellaceae bacterium]|jgi:Ni2+-binding GTPase involved in maturation of urease and hydrogenase|nr:cobalamin synthesis protein P47K [Prevotellaceae bacterium]